MQARSSQLKLQGIVLPVGATTFVMQHWLTLSLLPSALLCAAGDVGVKLRVSDAGEVSVEVTA